MANRCETCAVRHRSLCGALEQKEVERLSQISRRTTIPAGKAIVAEGDKAVFVANILSGTVKLTRSLEDGRRQIVGLQFPSDFLGRPFRTHWSVQAEAVSEVELCQFDRKQFEQMITDFPTLEQRLLARVLDELDRIREWLFIVGRKTAAERVASLLVMIADREHDAGCGSSLHETVVFDLPISRSEMADCLGLTIETVSRQMSQLTAQGAIDLRNSRSVHIPDLQRLRRIGGLAVDPAAI
ncbi:MAG: Crp/Fnr family transcriptional regulator [Hyphomicrobiaceae bacterium]|nr:Crp/Fnr family transcriptional regulator [Hyphomicrobiaceae bacterium]